MIWPDHDEIGRKAAKDAALALQTVGAASVRIVTVPDDFPAKWDLADAPPSGADLHALLHAARDHTPSALVSLPYGYDMRPDGLYFTPHNENGDKPPQFIADPFEIVGESRDQNGEGWGLLIRWKDREGRLHDWAIPKGEFYGDPAKLAGMLAERGLTCGTGHARAKLQDCLARVKPSRLLCSARQPGWHNGTFLLANGTSYGPASSDLVLQSGHLVSGESFSASGTLDDWKNAVARVAEGNSRLMFFLSAALTGPLLEIVREQSGGFHLVGPARCGKSTAAKVAGSVWGGGRQVRAWTATANGMEGIAAETTDTVLILDEIGQAQPYEAGKIVYALSNEAGKQRANQRGGARKASSWRTLFLSTGECTLEDKLREVGTQIRAGQVTRLANIPAIPAGGHGTFETLHEHDNGGALSDHLNRATARFYGTAGPAFLLALTAERARDEAGLTAWLETQMTQFQQVHAADAGAQAQSVAKRFALAGCAGERAIRYGIFPWPEGEAMRAAGVCFESWQAERGGDDSIDEEAALCQVRAFCAEHEYSRFQASETIPEGMNADSRSTIPNRVGFRLLDKGSTASFCLFRDAFRKEVCKGINMKAALAALRKHGLLRPAPNGTDWVSRRFSREGGPIKVYEIDAAILAT